MPIVDLNNAEDLSGLLPLWEAVIDGYRYVLYSGNRVQVYKGDGHLPAYTIDDNGCSCPAAQYGNPNCKHRSMFSYVGDGAPEKITEETGTSQSAIDSLL